MLGFLKSFGGDGFSLVWLTWFGLVWFGSVWYGLVLLGLAWFGLVLGGWGGWGGFGFLDW